eukprot:scaffold118860_cov63-Phaeocystis_antarctica.AAC.3
MRGEVQDERRGSSRAWGSGGESGAHAEDPTGGLGARHARRAHVEHVVHVRDAERVEVQRLVERRRALPSRKGGHAMWRAQKAWKLARGAAATQAARRRARLERLGHGMGGAHLEHAEHVRDAGRVEGQRLVEPIRALPSRKVGISGAGRGAGWEREGIRTSDAKCGTTDGKAWG